MGVGRALVGSRGGVAGDARAQAQGPAPRGAAPHGTWAFWATSSTSWNFSDTVRSSLGGSCSRRERSFHWHRRGPEFLPMQQARSCLGTRCQLAVPSGLRDGGWGGGPTAAEPSCLTQPPVPCPHREGGSGLGLPPRPWLPTRGLSPRPGLHLSLQGYCPPDVWLFQANDQSLPTCVPTCMPTQPQEWVPRKPSFIYQADSVTMWHCPPRGLWEPLQLPPVGMGQVHAWLP